MPEEKITEVPLEEIATVTDLRSLQNKTALLEKELKTAKAQIALLMESIGHIIVGGNDLESRASTLERLANTQISTAALYYSWVLALIAHTGLTIELKKKIESANPAPPPPESGGGDSHHGEESPSYEPTSKPDVMYR